MKKRKNLIVLYRQIKGGSNAGKYIFKIPFSKKWDNTFYYELDGVRWYLDQLFTGYNANGLYHYTYTLKKLDR